MIITFFGHSDYKYVRAPDQRKADEEKIFEFLERTAGDKECDFYLGGRGTFDDFAKDCCKKYKQTHEKCKLVYVKPYLNEQVYGDSYDETVYPPIERTLPKFAITKRNEWMIDNADYVVFYIFFDHGGTFRAYEYARRKKKIILHIQ